MRRSRGCDRCIRFHRRREFCCLFRPSRKLDTARNGGNCWLHQVECVRVRVCERPPISACAFRKERFPCRVLRTYELHCMQVCSLLSVCFALCVLLSPIEVARSEGCRFRQESAALTSRAFVPIQVYPV